MQKNSLYRELLNQKLLNKQILTFETSYVSNIAIYHINKITKVNNTKCYRISYFVETCKIHKLHGYKIVENDAERLAN